MKKLTMFAAIAAALCLVGQPALGVTEAESTVKTKTRTSDPTGTETTTTKRTAEVEADGDSTHSAVKEKTSHTEADSDGTVRHETTKKTREVDTSH